MTIDEFLMLKESDLKGVLLALWWDAKGDWERAHEVAQEIHTPDGSWIHAYLHRKEGDGSNARYWYSRAGKPAAHGNLDQEWRAIVSELLDRQD